MLLRPVLRSVALQILYINSFLPWILHFLSLFRHIGIDLPGVSNKKVSVFDQQWDKNL